MSGSKDVNKLDDWLDSGWRLAGASGQGQRPPTSAQFEGVSPLDRMVLVLEHD
jgi:hypothetical protein